MFVQLTMKQAKAEAPEAFAEIEKAKAASKTKTSLSTPLSAFKWEFSVAESIESFNFLEVIRTGVMPPEPPKLTVEQHMEDVKKRLGVHLTATKGPQHFYAKVDEIPKSVLDEYRAGYEKQDAEDRRIESLTPAQRDAEVQEALGQLVGTPGFAMFHMPMRRGGPTNG